MKMTGVTEEKYGDPVTDAILTMLSKQGSDCLVPEQIRHDAPQFPEQRLHFAVLISAILDLKQGTKYQQTEALRWINGAPVACISFNEACHAANLEPRVTRVRIMHYLSDQSRTDVPYNLDAALDDAILNRDGGDEEASEELEFD